MSFRLMFPGNAVLLSSSLLKFLRMLQTLRFVLFPWKKCMRTIEELETECHEPRHDGGIGKDVELFDSEGSDILLTNSALGDELVFDLEISPEQQREEEVELDITHIQSIQTLLGTSDPYLLELRRLTDRLSGKSVDDIANEMLKNNFNVIKRTVNNNLERSVHRLHHVFLVVLRPKELASVWDGEQEEIIIQTHFREQFITGCDQPQCAAFAKHLPESFVAEASTFRELIVLIAAQMEEAFLQGDESLPPWRAESAVLSKWFSQDLLDEPVTMDDSKWLSVDTESNFIQRNHVISLSLEATTKATHDFS